jgi:hypothetical protein
LWGRIEQAEVIWIANGSAKRAGEKSKKIRTFSANRKNSRLPNHQPVPNLHFTTPDPLLLSHFFLSAWFHPLLSTIFPSSNIVPIHHNHQLILTHHILTAACLLFRSLPLNRYRKIHHISVHSTSIMPVILLYTRNYLGTGCNSELWVGLAK